jgi:hypothetical protein
MTQFYHRDDASSVEYIDAIPRYDKTAKQKRMWRYIGMGVAAIVVIVVVVVVAVVVTDHKKNSGSASTSGNNQYPVSAYANMTEIVTNNSTQLQNKQRIFVIGDIHGCLSEFNALVEEINYNSNTDQLILAGDIMSKGPDSVGVVRRAKELGALCVRGNHDDKIIRFKTFENAKGKNAMYPLDATLPEGNVPDPLEFKNYHAALAV